MNLARADYIAGLTRRQLIELDACTRCGECLKWCPIVEATVDAKFSPMQKISRYRSLISKSEGLAAKVFGPRRATKTELEEFVGQIFECTTCGMCAEVCPVGINCQRLWPALRKKMVEIGAGPIGIQKNLPTNVKEFMNPYGKPNHERGDFLPAGLQVPDKAEIGYYIGCSGAFEAQPMVRGDVDVLLASGIKWTMAKPEDEICCGFPLFITGQDEQLEELVAKNVQAYADRGVKRLVMSCPCCLNIWSKDYPRIYGGPLPFEVIHMTQLAAELLVAGKLTFKKSYEHRVAYHDPCYLARGLNITEEPRRVLQAIPGIEYIELKRNRKLARCCGAGCNIKKIFSDLAIEMGKFLIRDVEEAGAEKLIMTCPTCFVKVGESFQQYETDVEMVDIMELVSSLVVK